MTKTHSYECLNRSSTAINTAFCQSMQNCNIPIQINSCFKNSSGKPYSLLTRRIFVSYFLNRYMMHIMADRANLSLSNEWIDRSGRVFIYFTIREICETLLCAHDKACRVLAELEEFGLIERQKQGQGNPTMIYVLPAPTSEKQNS